MRLETCISNKFSGDAEAAGPQSTPASGYNGSFQNMVPRPWASPGNMEEIQISGPAPDVLC